MREAVRVCDLRVGDRVAGPGSARAPWTVVAVEPHEDGWALTVASPDGHIESRVLGAAAYAWVVVNRKDGW